MNDLYFTVISLRCFKGYIPIVQPDPAEITQYSGTPWFKTMMVKMTAPIFDKECKVVYDREGSCVAANMTLSYPSNENNFF